tara:strand:+ start:4152 stop:6638 length:2487 start_codon:yes stop_codon:yes gene_type:complete
MIDKESMLNIDRLSPLPSDDEVLHIAAMENEVSVLQTALNQRVQERPTTISFSKKVFIPLTHLCRDVCHYCTFAQVPRKVKAPYLKPEEVLRIANSGAQAGCKEALFTLGDRPEFRYQTARKGLKELHQESTLSYLRDMADLVFKETGLFPHLNPGLMSTGDLRELRKVSLSMGIMLESSSERLLEKGMPHYGSPDKVPAKRLETIRLAGEEHVPFTTGILIGIGETRQERVESLLAIRGVDKGQVQEIIIQNFRAKPGTLMADAPEPNIKELLWTIAIARIIFGPRMNIQAPPNLSPDVLRQIVDAGINDWGGVSPVTPDFVNPEAPWPHLSDLARETEESGKVLVERLALYPDYVLNKKDWVDPRLQPALLKAVDGEGFARTDTWVAGCSLAPSEREINRVVELPRGKMNLEIENIINQAQSGEELTEDQIVRMLKSRGNEITHICQAADRLRQKVVGDEVTYCVNRNINYTNICYFRCQFCAFSKGKMSENLRGRPYDLSIEEIMRRTSEAWRRGATEVCLQGGIHPEYTGQRYIDICHAIKQVNPEIHIHAFSPLEVWHGAYTLGVDVETFLKKLKEAGLGTLPGTAAEILDDEVRAVLCPDKITTDQWLRVMEEAHAQGIQTTATIMCGHVERYEHIARHLLRIRRLQARTMGFSEFVILPFVHMEAPIYLKGSSRKGLTLRETILIHAISRLTLNPYFKNIQASWTKLGHDLLRTCLRAGVNDLGGTLMNETITRAAGASHGEETTPKEMERIIRSIGRQPRQRTTNYGEVNQLNRVRSFEASSLEEPTYSVVNKYERKKKTEKRKLYRPGLERKMTGADIV